MDIRVKPAWLTASSGQQCRSLAAERQISTRVSIGRLVIAVRRNNPYYREALAAGRLFLRLNDEGRRLEFLERGEGVPERIFGSVAVSQQGEFQLVDGSLANMNQERRLLAEEIFCGLGEAKVRQCRALAPEPDFWELPQLPMCPFVIRKTGKDGCIIQLAREARYKTEQLTIIEQENRLIVMAGRECLGVAPDVAEDGRQPVDLAKEAPVLNYGPWYEELIGRTLAAHDAQGAAQALLIKAAVYRRSFKLLELYARDYFTRGPLLFPSTLKIFSVLLEGIGLIEQETWYSREQRALLISEPSFITARGMTDEEIMELLAGTMKMSKRLGGLTGRQFAVVEIFWREMAQRKSETLTAEAAERIRQAYYSGRTA
jgi:hypothetical protein